MFFSKSDVYSKDWTDIIFAERNKEYGAYQLRIWAPKATNYALSTVVVIVTSLSLVMYTNSNRAQSFSAVTSQEVFIEVPIEEAPLLAEPILPEPLKADLPKQVAQDVSVQDLIKFTEIKATTKNKVIEDVAKSNELLDRKKLPANLTAQGVKGGVLVPKGTFGTTKREGADRGNALGSPTGNSDGSDVPVLSVEIMPEPKGGMAAFIKWVAVNYNYPQAAIDNAAHGVVSVSFVVEKDGSLSSFEVTRDLGYGTGAAAMKLLSIAKKWNPGIQNGRPVRVKYSLPLRLNTIEN